MLSFGSDIKEQMKCLVYALELEIVEDIGFIMHY